MKPNQKFIILCSKVLAVVAINVVFINCSNKTENTIKSTSVTENTKQESFEQFSQQFFTDSVFQISRITFPLRGMSTEYVFDEEETKDTITSVYIIKDGKFYWKKENWHTLTLNNVETPEYQKKLTANKNEVTIKYQSKADDFAIFFIFSLNDKNQWILTEYSDLWY